MAVLANRRTVKCPFYWKISLWKIDVEIHLVISQNNKICLFVRYWQFCHIKIQFVRVSFQFILCFPTISVKSGGDGRWDLWRLLHCWRCPENISVQCRWLQYGMLFFQDRCLIVSYQRERTGMAYLHHCRFLPWPSQLVIDHFVPGCACHHDNGEFLCIPSPPSYLKCFCALTQLQQIPYYSIVPPPENQMWRKYLFTGLISADAFNCHSFQTFRAGSTMPNTGIHYVMQSWHCLLQKQPGNDNSRKSAAE